MGQPGQQVRALGIQRQEEEAGIEPTCAPSSTQQTGADRDGTTIKIASSGYL
jgi:hypothetical protein